MLEPVLPPSRHERRHGRGAFVALLALALSACAAPAPPPTSDPLSEYQVFLGALKTGDVDTALERSWQARGAQRREQSEAKLRETVRLLKSGVLILDAVEARTEGNWALVVLRVTQRAGDGEVLVLRAEWLLGVDGQWRVVAPSRLGDRELAQHRDQAHESLRAWFRESEVELSGRWIGGRDSPQEP